MLILILIILFAVYPAVLWLFCPHNIYAFILIYCISAYLFFEIRRYKRKRELVILDKSIINDERITDILNSNLYSLYVLPRFVISDVEKDIKKTNNRHLKSVLRQVRHHRKVMVWYKNYFNIKNCDLKIIKLAKSLKAKILTANFNLKKMSVVQHINVVDINDLYERLVPAIVPGSKLSVFLVKEGREKNQAMGFLNDGTTVVVDEAQNFIGRKTDICITSVLRTSNSRMLFGKVD